MGALLGVDTGGTFTDLVCVDGDEIRTWKLPSMRMPRRRSALSGVVDTILRLSHGSLLLTRGTGPRGQRLGACDILG